jgi:hypothetical protein
VIAFLGVLIGCTGSDEVVVAPDGTPSGWPIDIVSDPQRFATLMQETDRDGWIAFHQNDAPAAWLAFDAPADAVGRSRAAAAQAGLYEDLDALSDDATLRLFASWERRGGPPAGGAAAIAALNDRCHGRDDAAWRARATPGAAGAVWLEQTGDAALWPPDPTDPAQAMDPFAARRVLHRRARDGMPEDLVGSMIGPFLIEPADGFEREFYDPCALRTLADLWRVRAGAGHPSWEDAPAAWADAGLAGLLFAPWLVPDDLRGAKAPAPGLIGARSPSLAALGIPVDLPATDAVDGARDEARQLAAIVDAWQQNLEGNASADGKALLHDLDLFDRFAQDWLVVRARYALANQHPRQALAYAQLAIDPTSSDVGVANSPAAYAVLARALVANGRSREALDALTPLSDALPETVGVREQVADLTVLEGLDRLGDSKEN